MMRYATRILWSVPRYEVVPFWTDRGGEGRVLIDFTIMSFFSRDHFFRTVEMLRFLCNDTTRDKRLQARDGSSFDVLSEILFVFESYTIRKRK